VSSTFPFLSSAVFLFLALKPEERMMTDLIYLSLHSFLPSFLFYSFSRGLGFESAVAFAKLNPARLIITSRSPLESGKAAVEQILHLTGYKAEVWTLDLMNLKSVESFATKAKTELERLDIFVSFLDAPRDAFLLIRADHFASLFGLY